MPGDATILRDGSKATICSARDGRRLQHANGRLGVQRPAIFPNHNRQEWETMTLEKLYG